jgi:ribosomal protein L11 methyltransferase
MPPDAAPGAGVATADPDGASGVGPGTGVPSAAGIATADPDGASAEGAWLELSVAADVEAVEVVSEILSRHAPGGTSVEPAFELVDEGLSARVDPALPAIVRAYLPGLDRGAARIAVREAREALGHLQAFGLRQIGELEVRVVHESDWADAWKSHFPVLRVGRRIVIRPTWRRHRRLPDDVVLSLDPGMAFGTGLHPTTRLCLEGIEGWADDGLLAAPGCRVLDVGCGSGILAIAAARLGAAAVLGVDTDPIAIDATRANARRNRVVRRVRARRGTLPTGERPADLVVANLIASLLVALAPEVRDEVRPGGRLLASGIFVDREPEVRSAFEAVGLTATGRRSEGDWVALEALRSDGSVARRSRAALGLARPASGGSGPS